MAGERGRRVREREVSVQPPFPSSLLTGSEALFLSRVWSRKGRVPGKEGARDAAR